MLKNNTIYATLGIPTHIIPLTINAINTLLKVTKLHNLTDITPNNNVNDK